MIIITGQLWPGGNQTQAKELLHATISNQSGLADSSDYFAHVLARPHEGLGVTGFEADIEVAGHKRHAGLMPLLISVLIAGQQTKDLGEFIVPASRTLKKLILKTDYDFQERLRGGLGT